MQKLSRRDLYSKRTSKRTTQSTSVRLRQDQLNHLEDGQVSPTVRRLLDVHIASEEAVISDRAVMNILEQFLEEEGHEQLVEVLKELGVVEE